MHRTTKGLAQSVRVHPIKTHSQIVREVQVEHQVRPAAETEDGEQALPRHAVPLVGILTEINSTRGKSGISDADLPRVLFIPVIWPWISNSIWKGLKVWPARNGRSTPWKWDF